jgi:HSP20 family protein
MEEVMRTHSYLPQLWREDQHPLRTLRQEMDEIFESWTKDLKLPEVAWPRTEFWPRVNISETDKEMLVTAELPGVDQKDIEVTVSGNQLLIKGEKKSEVEEKKDEKGRAFHRVERSFGSFQRLMSLPYEVDPEKVQASFKDGVLTLALPKPAEVQKKTKKIEIKGEKQIEAKKAA